MFNFFKKIKNNNKDEIQKYLEKCLENEQQINIQLQNENKKLLEWISKIICEVGKYKVDNDLTFKIPILNDLKLNSDYKYETLIIPRIEIIKQKDCKF